MTKKEKIEMVHIAKLLKLIENDMQGYVDELCTSDNEEQLEAHMLSLNNHYGMIWSTVTPYLQKYEKELKDLIK